MEIDTVEFKIHCYVTIAPTDTRSGQDLEIML